MIAKQPAVKRYIVKLSADERDRLNAVTQKGKAPARQALKARILLKADASEAGEAWSESEIANAPDTSIDTICRTRQQFAEAGLDAALTCREWRTALLLNSEMRSDPHCAHLRHGREDASAGY